ncbi:MAG: peptidylprolyl isomerase [Sulfurospirillum sp.]
MRISMKILLKISVLLTFMTTFSYAGLVNAISVIINNEPITLYEIYKYSNKFHISTKESLNILIRQKLEDADIARQHITASDFEVENYIKKLATKNGISEFQFLQMLKDKGIKESVYRKDVKKKIEQKKLYDRIFASKKIQVTPQEIKNYYKANKNKFVKAKGFEVVAYESPSKKSLEKIRTNPMLSIPDIKAKQVRFQSGNMNKNLESMLNQTASGDFTPAFKMGNSYTMFYVKAKNGVETMPFDKVKNDIYSFLASKKEKAAIDDYFEKIKSTANIKVLRKPNA